MASLYYNRVAAIREMMAHNGWDAVIITGTDPHGSEYPAARWKQVEWASGFTGETGDLAITQDHAGLWTDSRYFIQAVSQLAGSGIELHKTRLPESVSIPDWLAGHFADKPVCVAFDSLCVSADFADQLKAALGGTFGEDGYSLVGIPDLLEDLWEDRPAIPQTAVTTLDENEIGETRLQKLSWLRKFIMRTPGCDAVLLSSLDQIAWMLNVRGEDIEYNPYVISHLLVSMDNVRWYARKGEVEPESDTDDSFRELAADDVEICDYDELSRGIAELSEEGGGIFVDPSCLNYETWKAVDECFGAARTVYGSSPVVLRKAIKNPMEIQGFREACLEDGVAMEKFLWWLESEVASGRTLTEWDASVKLTSLRAEIPGYRGNSFENISAYGENAALPHYSTPRQGSAVIRPHGLYLVDSGGQYLFGTTDITRTVPMGECSELEKEDYTLVLKGMISLALAVFPRGTAGCQVDVLARNALWQHRRNFGHGTGHGIGFYLGVHEGPQDIRQNFNKQALVPGMVSSDEPGLYREGMHGIRHENMILCVEAGANEFGDWLSFETLTITHIDTAPIVRELMNADEIRWLNDYNESVYRRLSGRLSPEIAAWLRSKTLPI